MPRFRFDTAFRAWQAQRQARLRTERQIQYLEHRKIAEPDRTAEFDAQIADL
ncbi:hypothetical protein ABVF61_26845 [Roseibium sp. HPY-6]|uniref:hypothetical protein n=1 Tax=Roseibium sp. HPY-6 TaxID=3229852 RepID=UPI00338E75A2